MCAPSLRTGWHIVVSSETIMTKRAANVGANISGIGMRVCAIEQRNLSQIREEEMLCSLLAPWRVYCKPIRNCFGSLVVNSRMQAKSDEVIGRSGGRLVLRQRCKVRVEARPRFFLSHISIDHRSKVPKVHNIQIVSCPYSVQRETNNPPLFKRNQFLHPHHRPEHHVSCNRNHSAPRRQQRLHRKLRNGLRSWRITVRPTGPSKSQ